MNRFIFIWIIFDPNNGLSVSTDNFLQIIVLCFSRSHFVLEFVGLVLVVDRHGEYGRLREVETVGLVHFGQPFVFGELRRHVVDVFHSNRSGARSYIYTHNRVKTFLDLQFFSPRVAANNLLSLNSVQKIRTIC